MATFVKSRDKGRIGGLFGAPSASQDEVLPWSRTQQAAFLIYMGITVRDAVKNVQAEWAKEIRNLERVTDNANRSGDDPAFSSSVSLLTADVGIRGLLYVTNDLCSLESGKLALEKWTTNDSAEPDPASITAAVKSLPKAAAGKFLQRIAAHLGQFDWRSSAAPGLTLDEITVRKALRGSGGYREMRRLLLEHLAKAKDDVGPSARAALKTLKLS
jgi:hypothetical protein